VRAAITICLAILGILALLYAVTPKPGSSKLAPIGAAWNDVHGGIPTALAAFEVDNGFYPKGLEDLLKQPSNARNWHGSYFDPPKVPVDPWGRKYIYEYPGKHNTNGFDLFSAGPDGKAGTGDDIGNW